MTLNNNKSNLVKVTEGMNTEAARAEIVRVQPFRNGHMTIQNVPYVHCEGSRRGRLTPSTLKDIARLTLYMQESGVHEYDLRDFRNSSLYVMPYA